MITKGNITDKEKIRAEVERRLWLLVPKVTFQHQRKELENILSFIDSLQEEPASEDLEDAAAKYDRVIQVYNERERLVDTSGRKYFKLGANWQKEQMMKDAIDGVVICDEKLTLGYRDILFKFPEELKVGDKVKMIIIRED